MTGLYEVEITFHSYDNPTGRCAQCQEESLGSDPRCCDEDNFRPLNQSCSSIETCDPVMRICIRQLSTASCGILNGFDPTPSPDTNSFIFTSSFFGFSNPLLVVDTLPWEVSSSCLTILHVAM